MKKINFQYLSQLLEYKREEFFIKELVRYLSSSEQNASLILSEVSAKGSLLHLAIRNQLLHAVEAVIQHGADVNATTKTKQSAALIACEMGDWKILDFLLRNPKLLLEVDQKAIPFLCTVVRNLRERVTLNTDYTRCYHLLVNDGRVSVNAVDEYGNTPLHYAARHRNEVIAFDLLDRGAYIATNNLRGESPLLHFDHDLLSKYMDGCMAEGACPSSEGGIQFNYRALLPPEDIVQPQTNEMTAVHRMTEHKELRELVGHPFVAMFLSVKWSGFALFFNLNLLVYSLFCTSLLMYATLCYIYDDSYSYSLVLWFTVFATYSYVCLITFMNLLLVPQSTVRLFRCYVELVLIALAFMILFVHAQSVATRRIVTGSTVAVCAVELLLLIYTIQSQFVLSSLSHVKAFLMTIIHSFFLYCVLIVVFSLSFWTNQIHGTRETVVMRNGTQPVILTHLSPIAGIVKNAVHIMGEFDSSKVDLYAYAISYFIIFLFLVFVVIIIFNVFNKFMFPSTHHESDCALINNLLIKAWHLHKTEELLGKFRCTYNMTACLPRTLSLPYFIMAKMVRMFSHESEAVLIVCPLSKARYTVIIPGRPNALGVVGGGGESGAPPHHMDKRVQMDQMTFQQARVTLEYRQDERAQAQTKEEQSNILQRIEYKMDVLLERMHGEVLQTKVVEN